MPAMRFEVKWPDGEIADCYSPSTVITQYLQVNAQHTVKEFLGLSEKMLEEASHRVEQKFGYACSSAMDQLGQIRRKARQFEDNDQQLVTIISLSQR